MRSFMIPGSFIGRNEAERLSRSHWSKANEVKKQETETAMLYAMQSGIGPVEEPVDVFIVFCEQVGFFRNGKRKKPRDADNVHAAEKPILDGLVKAGIISDDGPDCVRRVIPVVLYVAENPHVTVIIDKYEPYRAVTFPPVEPPERREQS